MALYKPCMSCRRREYSRNGVFKTYKIAKDRFVDELEKQMNRLQGMTNAFSLLDIKTKVQSDYINTLYLKIACEEEFESNIQYYIQDDKLIEFLRYLQVDTQMFDSLYETFKNQHFCIHTHNFGYTIIVDEMAGCLFLEVDNGIKSDVYYASLKNDYKNINRQIKKLGVRDLGFAINLLIYMKEYPEQVKFGIPTDVNGVYKKDMIRNINQRKKIMITDWITDKQIDIVKSGKNFKCPHLRKKHIRHFYSDRFVNMKGKEIVIEAIEVKGQSKVIHNKKEV